MAMNHTILGAATVLSVLYIVITVLFMFISIIYPAINSKNELILRRPTRSYDEESTENKQCLKKFQLFTIGCITCTVIGCCGMFSSLLFNDYQYNMIVFIIGASLLPSALLIGTYKMDKYAKENDQTLWDIVNIHANNLIEQSSSSSETTINKSNNNDNVKTIAQ